MHILKKPDLSDPKLRAKLAKGMGHNYYGEPAWPNDLLYIFPVVILGTIACVVGLAVLDPAMLGDKADPFATPLEILPEWYLYPVFQILRVVPNKLLGIALQTMIPLGLMLIPFIESFNKFQNPFRRPVAMARSGSFLRNLPSRTRTKATTPRYWSYTESKMRARGDPSGSPWGGGTMCTTASSTAARTDSLAAGAGLPKTAWNCTGARALSPSASSSAFTVRTGSLVMAAPSRASMRTPLTSTAPEAGTR